MNFHFWLNYHLKMRKLQGNFHFSANYFFKWNHSCCCNMVAESTIHGSYLNYKNGFRVILARNSPICISNKLQVTSQQSFYVFNSSLPKVKLTTEESKQMKGSSCFLFVLFRLWASPWMYVLCMVFAVQNETVVKCALCMETNLQVETYQSKPFILPSSVTFNSLSKQLL